MDRNGVTPTQLHVDEGTDEVKAREDRHHRAHRKEGARPFGNNAADKTSESTTCRDPSDFCFGGSRVKQFRDHGPKTGDQNRPESSDVKVQNNRYRLWSK